MKDLDVYTITGEEQFTDGSKELGISMLDFWKFECSNIYDLQDEVSEFIVAKALEIDKPFNKDYWTRWDIEYPYKGRNVRVEVKTTAYYHAWQKENAKISEQRVFGIDKSNSVYDEQAKVHSGEADHISGENRLERPSDMYVFCLNTGRNREDAYPLEMKNWQFYVVSTAFIDANCGDQKTLSLSRIQKLGIQPIAYAEIKNAVEKIADGLMETT